MLGQRHRLDQFGQAVEVQGRGFAGVEQLGDLHVDAGCRQLGQAEQQAAQAAALAVERDGDGIAAGQRLLRHVGAGALGAQLDEDAGAGGVHRLDLGNELDAVEQVPVQRAADAVDVRRIGRAGGVGVDREARLVQRRRLDGGGEADLRAGHQLGVERAGNRQARHAHTGGFEVLRHLFDFGGGAGNDRLLGRVVVGDLDAAEAGDGLLHHLALRLHRDHGAGRAAARGLAHAAAAYGGQAQEVLRR